MIEERKLGGIRTGQDRTRQGRRQDRIGQDVPERILNRGGEGDMAGQSGFAGAGCCRRRERLGRDVGGWLGDWD